MALIGFRLALIVSTTGAFENTFNLGIQYVSKYSRGPKNTRRG